MKIGTFFISRNKLIKSVAIQGVRGSFHHIVSQEYFNPPVEVIECLSFDKVVESFSGNAGEFTEFLVTSLTSKADLEQSIKENILGFNLEKLEKIRKNSTTTVDADDGLSTD